jgi:hypothetical protein
MNKQSILLVLIALLLSSSMWFYFDHVLVPYQIQDSAVRHQPRGNLSDLYPRWLGSRELLLHGRNPYSTEVTREIQMGYYGRVLDPANPQDPKDQEGFAYPVYVAFFLAPTLNLPFAEIQKGFNVFLWVVTAIAALLWLEVVGWGASTATKIVVLALMLGSIPVVQGIKLQQLSLIVAALLAVASALVMRGQFTLGGIVLGLSSVKPQLALLVTLWFVAWVFYDWRRRQGLLWGLFGTIALLVGGGEAVLPHWIPQFWLAVQRYHEYTHNTSIPCWLFGPTAGNVISVFLVLICVPSLRRHLSDAETSQGFSSALSLVLALTVLVVPMLIPYNQVLLAPAILVLAGKGLRHWGKPWIRVTYALTALALLWPWVTSVLLMLGAGVLPQALILPAWKLPFYNVLILPPLVFAMILVDTWQAPVSDGQREIVLAER